MPKTRCFPVLYGVALGCGRRLKTSTVAGFKWPILKTGNPHIAAMHFALRSGADKNFSENRLGIDQTCLDQRGYLGCGK
ncbi:hypothetical protein Rcae01_03757 [Novipirellula caenicola]|uniref:Uncharacterized protein n=1 Tax=Novipirellula caenicola TaxID=1536901 RepID=A0ABP9VT08_9BACT